MRFTEKGTPGYSPSNVNWVAGDWRYDAWSLGAMVVEMRATEAFQKTRNGRHTLRLAGTIMKRASESEVVKQVIKKTLLVKKKEEMIDLKEIRELLNQMKKE